VPPGGWPPDQRATAYDAPRVTGVLSVERRGEIGVVTLHRPEKRNALSIELREALGETFAELGNDPGIGCIVLTGAGPAFCSGMDVTEFGGDRAHRRRLYESTTVAFDGLGQCPRPVVAAINGPALAGGFALALLCDLRVAAPDATFGYPELPRGIPPSYAAARAVLPATVAQELCLTGRIVPAPEAQKLGIVREVLAAGRDVVARGVELAERVTQLPRRAVIETKARTLLERRHLWGFLFDEERDAFRRAMLGPDEASAEAGGGGAGGR
jgi:enoyl-CoA hydratase/carnithine racemase